MKNDKKNEPEKKNNGIMPVVIISAALIGMIIVLKIIVG